MMSVPVSGMTWELRQGDALEQLQAMPAESVQCVVTSPPYYGLRDYGTGDWEGGEDGCDHRQETCHQQQGATSARVGRSSVEAQRNENFRDVCGKCGARRTDRQLGLEATPDEYVARMVEVFREVRRVLRADGTVWINLGDSYAGGGGGNYGNPIAPDHGQHATNVRNRPAWLAAASVKPKDLLGIPWLLAFALRADGWYLRSDIIWSKPNPMPESVTDRPTSAHEHVFLLSRSARYFYDADAIREACSPESHGGPSITPGAKQLANGSTTNGQGATTLGRWTADDMARGRNRRNVWEIATQPYPEAHFATFPCKLVEPCVLAGSSPKCCGVCGAPWVRVVERKAATVMSPNSRYDEQAGRNPEGRNRSMLVGASSVTTGWRSSCDHDEDDTGRCVILDPFAGSGTVGVVALRHDRSFIGIELSPAYVEMARRRIVDDAPLLNGHAEVAA